MCQCGITLTKTHLARHKKSNKHTNMLIETISILNKINKL